MAMNKQQIDQQVELVETLKMMAQAYEEISVLKMQRVRSSVLSTRDFLERLSKVFMDVRRNYKTQIQRLAKKKKMDPKNISFSTIKKNNKAVSIFISANANFYGDIVRKVFNLFIESIERDNSDVVILGKLGKQLFDNSGMKRPYIYYEVPDNDVKLDNLRDIVASVIQYEKVNVFYGRFNNVVTQEATAIDVSGELSLKADEDPNMIVGKLARSDYYFEPSLEKILEFFESSVFTSLFEQTVHEAELPRPASRIRAMEEALGNIEKTESELQAEGRRLTKSLQNKRQLDSISKIYMLVR